MYVNLFGLLCGIQLNIWLRRCLERLVTPARLAVFVCAVMPAGAVAMVLQAVGRVCGQYDASGIRLHSNLIEKYHTFSI